MLAIFDNLGFSELMIVVVVAVLVFGKRLPEVAAQAGAQIGKFRRSLQDIKTDTGIDDDIRKIQREIQNAVPRDLSMGEMARIASAELEKRMRANDERKEPETSAGADMIAKAAAASTNAGATSPSSIAPGSSDASSTTTAVPNTPTPAATHTGTSTSDASHSSGTPGDASRPSAALGDISRSSATSDGASRSSATLDGASRPSATLDGASRPSATLDGASRPSATLDGASRPSAQGIAAPHESGSETVRKD